MSSSRKADEYIHTYTGLALYPGEIRPEDIRLEDIAYGLSSIKRFNGHSPVSVLRHSLAVAQHFERGSTRWRWAMIHDAAEAYMMDVPRPLQRYVTSDWLRDYQDLELVIDIKFGALSYLGSVAEEVREAVKRVDAEVVEYEMDCGIRFGKSRMVYPCERKLLPADITRLDKFYQWSWTDEMLIEQFISLLS